MPRQRISRTKEEIMEEIKEATRDGFGKGIVKAGKNEDVVVLDADLAESTRSIKFNHSRIIRRINWNLNQKK